MAKQSSSNNQPATESKGQPLNAYVVDDSNNKDQNGRSYWTRVGVAFPHDDGKGFNIVITPNISVSGRLVIRERKPDDAQQD